MQQHLDAYVEDRSSSEAGSEEEIAQQMLMQEQFAAYEHHLNKQ